MIPTWSELWGTVPPIERWPTVLAGVAGLVLGYVVHPLTWPIGPIGYLCLLGSRAHHESGWVATAIGDVDHPAGNSGGILQFHEPTWRALTGRPPEDRASPFLSGYYGGALIQTAVLNDPWGALGLYLPFYQVAPLRSLWKYGEFGRVDFGTGILVDGGNVWAAYLAYRLLTLPLSILGIAALVALGRRRRRA